MLFLVFKNHPDQKYKQCPFNARHVVPALELNYHIRGCPDRVSSFCKRRALISQFFLIVVECC